MPANEKLGNQIVEVHGPDDPPAIEQPGSLIFRNGPKTSGGGRSWRAP